MARRGRPRTGNNNKPVVNMDLYAKDIQLKLNALNSKQQGKVISKTLRQAGTMLVRATRNKAKQSFKASASQLQGAQVISYWFMPTTVKVHIMGNSRKYSDSYKLKFFETGTLNRNVRGNYHGERVTLSGYSYTRNGKTVEVKKTRLRRGKIKAHRFFQRAQDETNTKVGAFIDRKMEENIIKQWSKK